MPNKRAPDKVMLAAQVTLELLAAVEAWRRAHPGYSKTHFVVDASIEKLQRDGIPIDPIAARRDFRVGLPAETPAPQPAANSAAKGTKDKIVDIISEEAQKRRRRPSASLAVPKK